MALYGLRAGVALAAMLAFGQAHAEFVHQDYASSGDNLVSYQTETNLQWLNLAVTSGLTIEEAIGKTGGGGEFAGWHLATDAEVESLMQFMFPSRQFDGDVVTSKVAFPATQAEAANWGSWLGTVGTPTSWLSFGQYYRAETGQLLLSGLRKTLATAVYEDYSASATLIPIAAAGVFLVKTGNTNVEQDGNLNDVPVPLFSSVLGLMLLMGVNRKRHRT